MVGAEGVVVYGLFPAHVRRLVYIEGQGGESGVQAPMVEATAELTFVVHYVGVLYGKPLAALFSHGHGSAVSRKGGETVGAGWRAPHAMCPRLSLIQPLPLGSNDGARWEEAKPALRRATKVLSVHGKRAPGCPTAYCTTVRYATFATGLSSTCTYARMPHQGCYMRSPALLCLEGKL